MSWRLLVLAAAFEAVWAVGLEYTDGFSKPLPTAATLGAMAVSVFLLARAVEDLPVGTAYAVWTGLGAVGAVVGGMVLFDEPRTLVRVGFIALVLAGVAGLHATSGA
jgi:quaternary ammonium compound-resistance protein SugE